MPAPKKIEFPDDPEGAGYRLFPAEYEDDPNILFHGTTYHNLQSISSDGFKLPEDLQPSASAPLPSLSFGNHSSVSLGYACSSRKTAQAMGVVIAARFDFEKTTRIVRESFGIHLYSVDPQPQVIAYVIVPASYRFA